MVEPLSESELASKRVAESEASESVASEKTATTASTTIEPQVIDCTDKAKVSATDPVDWKIEHQRKCQVFNEWCISNGVEMPKLEYPAYFEGGLVGVRATQPIEHREAFIKIPYKMLMTIDAAKNHDVLGQVIEENPDLFSDKKGDWEQLTLALYLIYEN